MTKGEYRQISFFEIEKMLNDMIRQEHDILDKKLLEGDSLTIPYHSTRRVLLKELVVKFKLRCESEEINNERNK